MKRNDLLRLLAEKGCCLHRHGGRHDIFVNLEGKNAPVPRHTEIQESLVKMILKQLGI
jgi:predicted RNA binding protein YcfA (HicA-like mRNA interferase family)